MAATKLHYCAQFAGACMDGLGTQMRKNYQIWLEILRFRTSSDTLCDELAKSYHKLIR